MASALPDRSPPQNPRPIAPAKAAPAPGSTGTGGTGERCSDRWNDGPSAEKSDRRRSRLFPSFLGHRTETAGGLQLYDWLPSCVHIYIHRRYIYEKNRKTRDIAQHPVQNRKKAYLHVRSPTNSGPISSLSSPPSCPRRSSDRLQNDVWSFA
jgi:hypothetical protein